MKPISDGNLDLLSNPLSSEFGVTTRPQMEQLIMDGLSSFKLVRRYCHCGIQQYWAVPQVVDRLYIYRYHASKQICVLLYES